MPDTTTNLAIRRFQCRHIFTDGHRCGSPCLRGEDFCYYHHGTRRPKLSKLSKLSKPTGVTGLAHDPYNEPPNQTTFTLPIPEDHSSVQLAIGTIMTGLASNALDPRRAGLLLYALQIVSGNLATAPHHSANDLVDRITLHPTEGTLAPKTELPEDVRHRELLQDLEDLEDEDDNYEEDDPDEVRR